MRCTWCALLVAMNLKCHAAAGPQVKPAPYVVTKDEWMMRDWVAVQQHRPLAAPQASVLPPLPPPPLR